MEDDDAHFEMELDDEVPGAAPEVAGCTRLTFGTQLSTFLCANQDTEQATEPAIPAGVIALDSLCGNDVVLQLPLGTKTQLARLKMPPLVNPTAVRSALII